MLLRWLRRKGAEILGEPTKAKAAGDSPSAEGSKSIPFYHQFKGLVRPVEPPGRNFTEWGLFNPMLYLSEKAPINLDRLREGIFISGITGSGKTSGPLYTFRRLFLDWQFGALILTVKPELDREFWQRVAEETGREENLIITISP